MLTTSIGIASSSSSGQGHSISTTLLASLGYVLSAVAGGFITYLYIKQTTTRETSLTDRDVRNESELLGSLKRQAKDRNAALRQKDPLDPEWFRVHGHSLIDWIVDYRSRLNDDVTSCTQSSHNDRVALPIQCLLEPGWLATVLPSHAPIQGESWSNIMSDVDRYIVPGLTHWQSPHFYGWFKNHASFPSFLGDMLSDAFSSVGFSWISSPASAELEAIVMDWCAAAFNLPHYFYTKSGIGGGTICLTAGEAAIIAMLTAKRAAMEEYENQQIDEDKRVDRENRLTLYVSDQAHGILQRAAKVVGIPNRRVRVIKALKEDGYRLSPDRVAAVMESDIAEGLIPFFLWITVGTTSTSAVDDIQSLSVVAHHYHAWVHADAAYGGVYAILPELSHLFNWSSLDSLNINAHKGFFTHFDAAFLWIKDRYQLVSALSLPGMAILKNAATDSGRVIDYKDWGLSFGRRFRSLKIWCMMRVFGIAKIQALLRWSITALNKVQKWMEEDGRFEIMFPQELGLLCFRIKPEVLLLLQTSDDLHIVNDSNNNNGRNNDAINSLNKQLLDECNNSGEIFFSQTMLDGILILRLSTSGVETAADIERDWKVIQKHLNSIIQEKKKAINTTRDT